MKPFYRFGTGFSSFWQAIPFLFRHKLGWTLLIPIVLTFVFIFGGWYFASWASNTASHYLLEQYTGLEQADFWFADTVRLLAKGLLLVILKLIIGISVSFLSGYVTLILLSPILTYVSAKTEEILTGHQDTTTFRQFMHDIWRGIVIALRNMLYELILNALLFFSFLIPVVGQLLLMLSPFLLFFISSYFYGFSFIDYYNERRQYTIKESVRFVRANAGIAFSIGGLFYLFYKIPFLGSIIGGPVAIVASSAAVIAIHQTTENRMQS